MRLIIADDHPLFLEAAKLQVERARPDAQIETAVSLDEALAAARRSPGLDALLLDLAMPGMGGVAGLARVRAEFPKLPVVVMSGAAAPGDVAALIRGGANGFPPKTLGPEVFVQALNVVLAGGTYLPTDLLSALDLAAGPSADQSAPPPLPEGSHQLTPRELQVLRAIVDGKSNKEIARDLDLQEVTVKLHARRAYQKLGARNRAQATAIAIEQKIIQRG
jgi:DNA-binding NarL/FixJ family response regulator